MTHFILIHTNINENENIYSLGFTIDIQIMYVRW